jgi:aspartyl-tRNA(Asn)/glutamyl-tRNA(Gln) amidotransferase subunit A
MDVRLEDFDALAVPTIAFVAPKIAEVAMPEGIIAKQPARNTNWVNFFDLCAISLPLPA